MVRRMREFLKLAEAFREMPILDDDFPQMRERFDLALKHMIEDIPKIVCLCGSTRFSNEFMEAQFRETVAGNIVLTVGCFPRRPDGSWDQMQITDEQKKKLDALHFRKIELADEIFVVDVGRYIGESTRNEINHAEYLGKPIRYRSEEYFTISPSAATGEALNG
jgi:hypothetical protein